MSRCPRHVSGSANQPRRGVTRVVQGSKIKCYSYAADAKNNGTGACDLFLEY